MRVSRYHAPEDGPEPWFKDSFEKCEVITTLVHPDKDDVISDAEHHVAWNHVKDCNTCLRNVSKALFMMGNSAMPLPVFSPRTEDSKEDPKDYCDVPNCPCGRPRWDAN